MIYYVHKKNMLNWLGFYFKYDRDFETQNEFWAPVGCGWCIIRLTETLRPVVSLMHRLWLATHPVAVLAVCNCSITEMATSKCWRSSWVIIVTIVHRSNLAWCTPPSSRLCPSAVAANPKDKVHVHCSSDQTNKKVVNKKNILPFK